MLYFLYGEDSYRARQKLNEIINAYKEKHSNILSLKRFDLKDDSFEEFAAELRGSNLFGKKLIIAENILYLPQNDQEKFNSLVFDSREDKEKIIIFFEPKAEDSKNKIFKTLKDYSKTQEFKKLEGAHFVKWLKEEIQNQGGEIDLNLLKTLAGFWQDSWEAVSEIKKLISYSPKITEENVLLLSRYKTEISAFKLIDALAEKQKANSFYLLEKILSAKEGENELNVLGLIAYYFRNMIRLYSLNSRGVFGSEAAKASGIHPYAASKMNLALRRFSSQELKKIYSQIMEADLAVKTGKLNPKDALFNFLLNFSF